MLHMVAISFAVTFGLLLIIFRIVFVVSAGVSVVTEGVSVVVSVVTVDVSVVSLMFLSCLRQVYEVYVLKKSPAFWRPFFSILCFLFIF